MLVNSACPVYTMGCQACVCVRVRAQELALLASDSFMTLSGRDEPRGHIPALPNTPGKHLLTVLDQTRIQFAPRGQEKRV